MSEYRQPGVHYSGDGGYGSEPGSLQPAVDVIEDVGGISLYADMPGVSREALALHVEGDTLTIEGVMAGLPPTGMDMSHLEVAAIRYRRSFTLSRELDVTRISAEFQQGVLKLRIPKAEQVLPRRVEIHVD